MSFTACRRKNLGFTEESDSYSELHKNRRTEKPLNTEPFKRLWYLEWNGFLLVQNDWFQAYSNLLFYTEIEILNDATQLQPIVACLMINIHVFTTQMHSDTFESVTIHKVEIDALDSTVSVSV